MTWAGVLVACAACYALKLAGLSLPAGVLADPRVQRTVPLVPVALLAALVATQTFASGHHLVLDVRAAALAGRRRHRRAAAAALTSETRIRAMRVTEGALPRLM